MTSAMGSRILVVWESIVLYSLEQGIMLNQWDVSYHVLSIFHLLVCLCRYRGWFYEGLFYVFSSFSRRYKGDGWRHSELSHIIHGSSLKSDYLNDRKFVYVIITRRFNQTRKWYSTSGTVRPVVLSFISLSDVIIFNTIIFRTCCSYYAQWLPFYPSCGL